MDGITIYAILHEASIHLPLKVQKITQPDPLTVVFALWSKTFKGNLILSLTDNKPVVGFSDVRMKGPLNPSGFCLGLRKRLEGGILDALKQEGLDRVVYLEFTGHDDLGNQERYTLVLDGAGKGSNIGLYHEDTLVISIKPLSGERFTASSGYVPPDSSNRVDLLKNPVDMLVERFAQNHDTPLEKFLLSSLSGFGKELAQGVAFQISNCPADSRFSVLRDVLCEVQKRLVRHEFEPAVYADPRDQLVFHVIPLPHFKKLDTFSTCLEGARYYIQKNIEIQHFNEVLRGLESLLKKITDKLRSRYEAQKKDWEEQGEYEKYRLYGELLDASGENLPAGRSQVEVLDYYKDPPGTIIIPLDPRLSLKENARHYYAKYKKFKRGRDILEKSMEEINRALVTLDSIRKSISQARSVQELQSQTPFLTSIAKEYGIHVPTSILETNHTRSFEKGRESAHNYPDAEGKGTVNAGKERDYTTGCQSLVIPEGYQIFYGRSAEENEYMYHRIRRPGDIWLHAKNVTGAHVILRPPAGKEITQDALLQAARIAAENSSARHSSKVEVDWVDALKVSKPRGGAPGFVTYTGQKTILVSMGKNEPDENT